MSKHETPLIEWYWNEVGGTLCEEYRVVSRSRTCAARWVDAIILPNRPKARIRGSQVALTGEDVIVVQAKASRLGMYLAGQAILSARLVASLGARSVRSVALCTADDSALRPLLGQFEGVEVVVAPKPAR
jgi:hypothetical protein